MIPGGFHSPSSILQQEARYREWDRLRRRWIWRCYYYICHECSQSESRSRMDFSNSWSCDPRNRIASGMDDQRKNAIDQHYLHRVVISFPLHIIIKLLKLTRYSRSLFKNIRFTTLFLAGGIGTFPLFVPPFFLPLYSKSVGLTASQGAGLVAGFNFSSAVGRLICGFLCDWIGPVNTLFIALALSAMSMLVIWPVSTSLGPLIAFVVINGAANGGFFSTMPTVVMSVFGSRRVGVAMGMIVSGWAGGYLMVRTSFSGLCTVANGKGCANRWISPRCLRR